MPAAPDWQPTRYLAWLYSPPPHRPLLQALFDIEREIASSVRPGLDHQVAHARLQWWRDECDRCASGHPVHPLTCTLVAASRGATHTPSLAGLAGLVDTAAWDLAGATFESRRELTAYCERWAAAILQPIVMQAAPGAFDWKSAGGALRELELLARLADEAHLGRLRVPLEELERTGVDPEVLGRPPWPLPLSKVLEERHAALRGRLGHAMNRIGSAEQRALRGVLVWARLIARGSERAQRALPASPRPRRIDLLTDTWHAWNTARSAIKGRLRPE